MSGCLLESNLTEGVRKVRRTRVGYIRVSTADQNTVRQLDGVGVERVFTAKASDQVRLVPLRQRGPGPGQRSRRAGETDQVLALLINAVIFHTTLDRMMGLRQFAAEGWQIKPEDLVVLSP